MQVLDKGFVKLIDYMGSDLRVVNTARVSTGKHKDEFGEEDAKLIEYLAKNHHTSPFRSCFVTFHIKAPIYVMRQWMRHNVGCTWLEKSGRYVEFEPEFYIPDEFRENIKSIKQGSGMMVPDQISPFLIYKSSCEYSFQQYKDLLERGICKEQARGVLPLSMYTELYWTASLQAIAHFLALRQDSHAQKEIREFANAVHLLTEQFFPISLNALLSVKQV